jgi:hypothetical protein
MPIEKVRDFYSIKFLIPYNMTTFKPFGVFRVIQELNFERTIDLNDLTGGHIAGAWDTEPGQPENSLTGTIREYPYFAFEILEGADTIETAVEATGNIGSVTNKNGTSVVDATTGIASVIAKSGEEDNIKGIRYVFVATGASTVDIYVHGDATFANIQGAVVENVTVPGTGGTVDVDSLGITITGGSGAISFTTDDTAYADTRPIHSGFGQTQVGQSIDVIQRFGLICVFPKKSDGAQFFIDLPEVVAAGMPWAGVSREWSEFALNAKPIVNSDTDSVYTLYTKLPD